MIISEWLGRVRTSELQGSGRQRLWRVATAYAFHARRLRLAAPAALALGAALILSGAAQARAPRKARELTTVNIAFAAPVADLAMASLAEDVGIFKKNGIKANVEYLQQSVLMPALVSGELQFGVLSVPAAEIAAFSGDSMQYVAEWENRLDFVTVANAQYKTVKSLNGQSEATTSPGSTSDLLVALTNHNYKISMRALPVGSTPNEFAAFEKGTVAALSLGPAEVATVEAADPGAHILINWLDQPTVLPGDGLVGTTKWMASHKKTTIEVVRSMSEAVAYFRDKKHRARTVQVIMSATGQPHGEAESDYAHMRTILAKTIVPPLAAQVNALKLLAPEYPAAKTYNAKRLLDASYADAALK